MVKMRFNYTIAVCLCFISMITTAGLSATSGMGIDQPCHGDVTLSPTRLWSRADSDSYRAGTTTAMENNNNETNQKKNNKFHGTAGESGRCAEQTMMKIQVVDSGLSSQTDAEPGPKAILLGGGAERDVEERRPKSPTKWRPC